MDPITELRWKAAEAAERAGNVLNSMYECSDGEADSKDKWRKEADRCWLSASIRWENISIELQNAVDAIEESLN